MRRLTLLPTLMEADEEFSEKIPLTEASLLMLALVNSGKAIRRASEQLLLPTHRPSFVTARSRVAPFILSCILLLLLEVGLRLRNVPTLLPSIPLDDPYAQPGRLVYDPADPLATRWLPFGQTLPSPDWHNLVRLAGNLAYPDIRWNGCTPNQDVWQQKQILPLDEMNGEQAARLQQDALRAVAHLQDATILILGDSVDRNSLQHLSMLYQTPAVTETYNGSIPDAEPSKALGYPHLLSLPEPLNINIVNGFFYGVMDKGEEFSSSHDWSGPGQAENRVEELFKVYTDRKGFTPSLISLHSGMWDLAYFGRQDRVSRTSTEEPLSEERLAQWQLRMTSTIRKIKSTWPGVPIVFRKLHRVGPSRGAEDWQPRSGNNNAFVNFFTDVRFHQIRNMQEAVARQEKIAVLDFGALFEGFQQYQDKVHPILYPAGPLMANALFHHAYLAKHQPGYNGYEALPSMTSHAVAALRKSRAAQALMDLQW